MIKFSHNFSSAVKIKSKNAIGFLKTEKQLEIWYRGVQCNIDVETDKQCCLIDENVFEQLLLKQYKEEKRELKRNNNINS